MQDPILKHFLSTFPILKHQIQGVFTLYVELMDKLMDKQNRECIINKNLIFIVYIEWVCTEFLYS